MQNREGNSATELTKPTGARNHKGNCQCGLCLRFRTQAASAARKEAMGRKVRRRLTPRNRRFVQEFSDPQSPGHRCAELLQIAGNAVIDNARTVREIINTRADGIRENQYLVRQGVSQFLVLALRRQGRAVPPFSRAFSHGLGELGLVCRKRIM